MVGLVENEVVLQGVVGIVVVVAHHDIDGEVGRHDGAVVKHLFELDILVGVSPVGQVAADEDGVELFAAVLKVFKAFGTLTIGPSPTLFPKWVSEMTAKRG